MRHDHNAVVGGPRRGDILTKFSVCTGLSGSGGNDRQGDSQTRNIAMYEPPLVRSSPLTRTG